MSKIAFIIPILILVTLGMTHPKLAANIIFEIVMKECLPYSNGKNESAKLKFINCMKELSRFGGQAQAEWNKNFDARVGDIGKFLHYSEKTLGIESLADKFFDNLSTINVKDAINSYTNKELGYGELNKPKK